MKRLVALCAAVFLIGLSGIATAESKIGVVDLQAVLQKAPQAATIQADLQKQFGVRDKELQTMWQAYQADVAKLNKDSAVMKAADRKALTAKLETEQKDFQAKQSDFQRDLSAEQNKRIQALLDSVKTAVSDIAATQKFDLVLLKASVAYSPAQMDITDQVVAALKK